MGSLKHTDSPPGLGDFGLPLGLILFIFLCPGLCTWVGALSCLQRGNQSSFNELEVYLDSQ